jgi:hypothetical protein
MGQPGGPHDRGDAVVLPGHADQRTGLVLAAERHRRAGAQRQGGLALLHGPVTLRVAGVGRDAEVGVEPVESLLSLDRGQGPPEGPAVVGFGGVV